MKINVCNYCGQSLPFVRLGIKLTEKKARIFDLVMRTGSDGIDGRDLFDIVFGDQEKEVEVDGVRGHIDCLIDGWLVDVKSCSQGAFPKFKDGDVFTNDPFAYFGIDTIHYEVS